jgi:hypothetical protein
VESCFLLSKILPLLAEIEKSETQMETAQTGKKQVKCAEEEEKQSENFTLSH